MGREVGRRSGCHGGHPSRVSFATSLMKKRKVKWIGDRLLAITLVEMLIMGLGGVGWGNEWLGMESHRLRVGWQSGYGCFSA